MPAMMTRWVQIFLSDWIYRQQDRGGHIHYQNWRISGEIWTSTNNGRQPYLLVMRRRYGGIQGAAYLIPKATEPQP